MNRPFIIRYIRLVTAVLLIALEFTNLIPYWAEYAKKGVQHSRYPFQYLAYRICLLIIMLDQANLKRLMEKGVTRWVFAVLILITWAMLLRTFNLPVGFTPYLVFRTFGTQVNSLGFLLICVILFDDPYVLSVTKRAIVVATLAAIPLIIYDVFHPGIFSNIPTRGAGLYVQPNSAGMALVFGCLIGISAISSRWLKELFVLCCAVGVLATFSRQAMVTLGIILMIGAFSGIFSARRLIIAGALLLTLFLGSQFRSILANKDITAADWNRLTLQWSDDSARSREQLAYKTLEAFEDAPILGNGFGTTDFWNDDPGHNSYLMLMADCGIVGVLVIPALLWSIRQKKWEFYALAGSFLLWGVFNHQVLDEMFSLVTIAIFAVNRTQTKRYLAVPLQAGAA
jgi:hypothetical protein